PWLVGVWRRLELRVEHLGGTRNLARDSLPAEDKRGRVFLPLDLAAKTQTHAHEQRAHRVTELRLRQDEEVVVVAPPHDNGRDHACLRRQQECGTRPADL